MTNTTGDTDFEANTVSGIGTLDEMDGSGFTWGFAGTGRKTMTITLTEITGGADTGYLRIDDTTDTVWSSLGAGPRSVQGVLFYKHDTSDAISVPVAWIEFASPFTANGGDLTVQWDANGIIQFGKGTYA